MAMMTGRVLLVCALCVLWCGAGGVYARDIENKALGGCMASGVLGAKTSYLPNGCNKYMPTPPLRSALPIPAIQAEVVKIKDNSQNEDNLSDGTSPGSGSGGGGGGSPGAPGGSAAGPPGGSAGGSPAGAATSPGPPAAPGVSGPAGPGGPGGVPGRDVSGGKVDSVLPSPGVHASPHIDDTVMESSDLSTTHIGSREEVLQQEATETHDSSPSKERAQEALPDVQQQQISNSENIKTDCDDEASTCEDEQSVGKAKM
ncbi:mucin-associated surface protein (MASP), putative, partial [Trypanosoma cruzi]